ncbi:hypothetical protein CL86_gp102 [Mycobacterium phage SkiPole]|uniref:Uncharacterized protein n=1 Tax=Mycobacterium phage SkiPole TaxID=701456 RepID=D2XRU6_9CAUD|nr:hypothetical protein CL86_gp102 [Mycobacterium phage SkiPole]ADA83826.1 hypothetical protein SKIPOLE_102 [Mycobacterium phage SkiPole]
MTPSAGVHPVYHTPARQRNPLCAASLRTPAGVPRTLPTHSPGTHTPCAPTPHPALPTPVPRTPCCPTAPLPVRRPVRSMRQAPRYRGCAELDADSTADAMRARDRRGSASRGCAELRDRADVPGSKLAFDADRIDGSGVEFVGCFAPSGFDRATDDGVDQPSMGPAAGVRGRSRGSRGVVIGPLTATRPVDGGGLSRGR